MNQAPPQKSGLSPLAIVGIVVGILILLGLATCGIGGYFAGKKLGEVKRGLGDGGLVIVSPPEVIAALESDKHGYVGTWTSRSEASTLTITKQGEVKYLRNETTAKTTLNGPIAAFEGNDIVMKLGIEFRIKVTQTPKATGKTGKWEMVADGITFYRDPSPEPTGDQ